MLYLRKAHIGEIQSSLRPPEMVEQCRQQNIVPEEIFTIQNMAKS